MTDLSDFIIEEVNLDKYRNPTLLRNELFAISYANELIIKNKDYGGGFFYYSIALNLNFDDILRGRIPKEKSLEFIRPFMLGNCANFRLKLNKDLNNLIKNFDKKGFDPNNEEHMHIFYEHSKDYDLFKRLNEKYKDIIPDLDFVDFKDPNELFSRSEFEVYVYEFLNTHEFGAAAFYFSCITPNWNDLFDYKELNREDIPKEVGVMLFDESNIDIICDRETEKLCHSIDCFKRTHLYKYHIFKMLKKRFGNEKKISFLGESYE